MQNKNKSRITSETEFYIEKGIEKNNAIASKDRNLIGFGIESLTLETLIHELNEIQINVILDSLEIPNYKIFLRFKNEDKEFFGSISHFLAPYGLHSIINPYKYGKKEHDLTK
jgi:hypothetical protein